MGHNVYIRIVRKQPINYKRDKIKIMNKYRITLDASYCYKTDELEANNILHLLSIIADAYSISRITKIELISK